MLIFELPGKKIRSGTFSVCAKLPKPKGNVSPKHSQEKYTKSGSPKHLQENCTKSETVIFLPKKFSQEDTPNIEISVSFGDQQAHAEFFYPNVVTMQLPQTIKNGDGILKIFNKTILCFEEKIKNPFEFIDSRNRNKRKREDLDALDTTSEEEMPPNMLGESIQKNPFLCDYFDICFCQKRVERGITAMLKMKFYDGEIRNTKFTTNLSAIVTLVTTDFIKTIVDDVIEFKESTIAIDKNLEATLPIIIQKTPSSITRNSYFRIIITFEFNGNKFRSCEVPIPFRKRHKPDKDNFIELGMLAKNFFGGDDEELLIDVGGLAINSISSFFLSHFQAESIVNVEKIFLVNTPKLSHEFERLKQTLSQESTSSLQSKQFRKFKGKPIYMLKLVKDMESLLEFCSGIRTSDQFNQYGEGMYFCNNANWLPSSDFKGEKKIFVLCELAVGKVLQCTRNYAGEKIQEGYHSHLAVVDRANNLCPFNTKFPVFELICTNSVGIKLWLQSRTSGIL